MWSLVQIPVQSKKKIKSGIFVVWRASIERERKGREEK
jgi:hypothetical protein